MVREYSYPVLLSREYEGGLLWVANFVGLHGCWVEGEDMSDVLERAPVVLEEYLRCCIDAGIFIPEAPCADELRSLNAGEVVMIRAIVANGEDNAQTCGGN